MNEIRHITDIERHLTEQVQALQSQADELLLENNLIRARNERMESDAARPESIDVGLLRAELARFKEFSKLAYRAMNDAKLLIDTISDTETDEEFFQMAGICENLTDLCYQALSLNGVTSITNQNEATA